MRCCAAHSIPFQALLLLIVTASGTLAHDTGSLTGPGIVSQRLLVIRFAEAPTAPAHIAIVRFILPPGSGIESVPVTGPRLFLVESGEVTLSSGDPTNPGFFRAADAPASILGPSATYSDAVLRPGMYFAVTQPIPVEVRNEATQAAVILHSLISGTPPTFARPATSANGAITDPLVSGVASALPPAPVELQFDRVGIDTGKSAALPSGPGPRLLVVESGTLGLAAITGEISYSSAASNNPGSVAGRVRTVVPGTEVLLTARGSAFLQPDAAGTARNLGRNRLTLLMLSIVPAPIANTPRPAAGTATPSA